MKIAVYHNQHAGGAARVIEAYLAHRGKDHHVEIFSPETADTGFVDLARFAQQEHRFPIPGSESPLGRYRRAFSVPKYGKRIAAAIDGGGFDVAFVNLSFVTQSPEVLPYLKTPSVYYCPEPLRAVYDKSPFPDPVTLKGLAKKLFFWGYDTRRKAFDRSAIKQADALFTHSNFTKKTLRRIYGVEASVVYLGVDTDTFRPLGRTREGFVLSVGALHPIKGHQFIVDALATLPAERRPRLVVVGPRGDFALRLEPYARERGVELEIKSGIATEELVELYNRAGVFAAAQYNEPFGLITLEAMACRTAVVAVDEGGLKETVSNDTTGLLVERNPGKFAGAVDRVLTEPALAERLGAAGHEDVTKRWRWSETASRIDEMLRAVASRS